MLIAKYGSPTNRCIVLIHGSFVTGEMWNSEVQMLKNDYYVLVPTLNGHNAEETVEFPGIEQEAKNIVNEIKEHQNREIFAIIGSSLGGTIALEIAANAEITIKHIISDGGFFTPISPIIALLATNLMTNAMILVKNCIRLFSAKGNTSKSVTGIGMFKKVISTMSRNSIKNIFRSTYQYKLPDNIGQISSRINIWYGSKENYFVKKSAQDIKRRAPTCILHEFIGLNHGDLALKYPDRYVQEIQRL
jgi:esterase/lipase